MATFITASSSATCIRCRTGFGNSRVAPWSASQGYSRPRSSAFAVMRRKADSSPAPATARSARVKNDRCNCLGLVAVNRDQRIDAADVDDLLHLRLRRQQHGLAALAGDRLGTDHDAAQAHRGHELHCRKVDDHRLAGACDDAHGHVDLVRAGHIDSAREDDLRDVSVEFLNRDRHGSWAPKLSDHDWIDITFIVPLWPRGSKPSVLDSQDAASGFI